MKKQFTSINLALLPANYVSEIEEIKDGTENFSDPDLIEVYQENWDTLFSLIEKNYPNALGDKKAEQPSPIVKKTTKKQTRKPVLKHHARQKSKRFHQEEESEVKEESMPKTVVEKIKKAAKVKKEKAPVTSIKNTTAYPREFTHLKAFIAFNGKQVNRDKVAGLYNRIAKDATLKTIDKNSTYAELIKYINKSLHTVLSGTTEKDVIEIEISTNKLADIQSIIKGTKTFASIALIKRFLSIQGKVSDKAKVEKLLSDVEKSLSIGKVNESDIYFDKLKKIHSLLKAHKGGYVSITETQLNGILSGLSGLGAIQLPVPTRIAKEVRRDLFKNMRFEDEKPVSGLGFLNDEDEDHYNTYQGNEDDQVGLVQEDEFSTTLTHQKPKNVFRLKGEMGKLLGDLQRFKLSISVSGDPHAGKSEFVKQLADAFLDEGMTVGFFDLEQGGLDSKDTYNSIRRNLKPHNVDKLKVAGSAKYGIDTIRKYATKFDVVMLDSWQKLGTRITEFDRLRHDFPNTIFVIIFQQNGNGGTRGGVVSDFDTPVRLKVFKVGEGPEHYKENYAEVLKNRGNAIGLKYSIFKKSLINQ